jgi:hypothetical protein
MMVNLTGNPDVFVWKLNTSGAFIVKSMYSDLMNGHTLFFAEIHLVTESTTKDQDLYVVSTLKKSYS